MTAAGRRELRSWLATPLSARSKDPLLARVAFLDVLPPGERRAAILVLDRSLAEEVRRLRSSPAPAGYRFHARRGAIDRLDARRRWLQALAHEPAAALRAGPGQEEVTTLAAVVPAAGLSRRMGREKILLPLRGSTLLETIVATLAAAGVTDVVMVLRPDLPEAAARAREAGARVVFNAHPEEEMLVSIRLGLEAISPGVLAVFIWPADHPAVSRETIELLAARADPARALVPSYRSRRGHPALIGRDLFAAIGEIPPREGLRHLWRMRPEALIEVPVEDPGVIRNIDTPEDYQRLIG